MDMLNAAVHVLSPLPCFLSGDPSVYMNPAPSCERPCHCSHYLLLSEERSSQFAFRDLRFETCFRLPCFPASVCTDQLFLPSGKPSSSHPVRLLGQVLHATLQDLEFTELHNQHQGKGQPLYCQGVFDAITIGEIDMEVLSLCSSVIGT